MLQLRSRGALFRHLGRFCVGFLLLVLVMLGTTTTHKLTLHSPIPALAMSAVPEQAALQPTTLSPGQPLRIMTFNMRHALGNDGQVDLNRVALLLAQSQADIIALQEVDRYWPRSGYRDQAAELAQQLNMYWRFSPSLRQGSRQYGNAILSRYPIEHSEAIALPGEKEPRSLLEAYIRTEQGTVRVVTTHLGVGSAERSTQMKRLLKRVASYNGPTVLMGDLNMSGTDPHLAPLESRWSRLTLPEEAATLHGGGQIDHIFVNFDSGSIPAWTSPTAASDHNPVFALLGRQ